MYSSFSFSNPVDFPSCDEILNEEAWSSSASFTFFFLVPSSGASQWAEEKQRGRGAEPNRIATNHRGIMAVFVPFSARTLVVTTSLSLNSKCNARIEKNVSKHKAPRESFRDLTSPLS